MKVIYVFATLQFKLVHKTDERNLAGPLILIEMVYNNALIDYLERVKCSIKTINLDATKIERKVTKRVLFCILCRIVHIW